MTSDAQREMFEDVFLRYFPKNSVHREGCEAIWQAALASLPRMAEREMIGIIMDAGRSNKQHGDVENFVISGIRALIARLPHIVTTDTTNATRG